MGARNHPPAWYGSRETTLHFTLSYHHFQHKASLSQLSLIIWTYYAEVSYIPRFIQSGTKESSYLIMSFWNSQSIFLLFVGMLEN
jgi:hypothetical protein